MDAWEHLEPLGAGGMGQVVRARHRHTGVFAALKTVQTDDAVQRAALRREIRALAMLRHPGVARILDEGTTERGAWYAMTLIDAPTLADAWSAGSGTAPTLTLDSEPLDPRDAGAPIEALPAGRPDRDRWIPTIAALAATLAHVHGHGLVHGDLKPANVLLPTATAPVLVDFGLTSRLGAREHADRLVSVTVPLGTPAYMAPERCAGAPFDTRADLYALGCMLYELVAGAPPFVGPPADVLRAHRRMQPWPLDDRVPGVPAELVRLVERLLARDPRDRPASAAEVAKALGVDVAAPRVAFRPRLAGRDDLVARLGSALDGARSGRGAAIALTGEGGAGKTRLAMETLSQAHAHEVRVVSGQCVPLDGVGASPLSAVSEAVRTAVRLAQRGGPGDTRRLFGDHARLLEPWFPTVAQVPGFELQPPRPELPPEVGRPLLVHTLARVVLGIAARPTVFFVDDVQWADPLALELLRLLAEEAPRHPLLLLATARPEARIPPAFETLVVGPLDAGAARRIVSDMLGTEPSDALLDHVVRVAEGSPFLLTEAVRAALASSDLAEVPDARGLARRRVAVDGTERSVLDATLVLGRRATPARIAAIGSHSEDEVLDATYALDRADLLVTAPDGSAAFTHAHLRDAVSAGLDPGTVASMHRAAAALLRTEPGIEPFEVADHLYLGDRPSEARPLYRKSARDLLSRYAPEGAELWLRRAAETDVPDADAIHAALDLAGSVLLPLGRAADARDAVAPHLPHADALGDPLLQARVRVSLAASHRILGEYEPSRELAHAAAGLAQRDAELEAAALAELASLATVTNELERAVELCRQARALQPRGPAAHRLLKAESLALWHLNRTHEAVEVGEQLVAFAAAGSPYEQADARYTLATVQLEAGDAEGCRQGMQAAMEAFEALGARRGVALCQGNLAGVACREGRFRDAIAPLESACDTLRSLGDPRSSALTALNLAYVHESLDQVREAADTYEGAAAVLEQLGDTQLPRALVGLARTSRLLGAPVDVLDSILARSRSTPTSPSVALLLAAERVRLAVLRGDDPAPALAAMEALYAQVGATEYVGPAVLEARAAASGTLDPELPQEAVEGEPAR
ncbi:MAG: AAA family ATPase [Myxococcota bacterium]